MPENAQPTPALVGMGVRNAGSPLRIAEVEPLVGFTAGPGKGGMVRVWTQLALTSDEPLFHRLVDNLDGVIRHMAQKGGATVNLRRADMVLLIVKPDCSAELWVDTAAVALRCAVKRSVAAGTAVFESDIADVTGMTFPCVSIEEKDKVLCLFREGWSFGLAFDFNPDGKLDAEWFTSSLGALLRHLRFRHLYQAINDPDIFDPLVAAGWFPFVEIISTEFRDLMHHAEAGRPVTEIEPRMVAAFNAERVGHLLERWIAKPHFAMKADLLKEAVEAFAAGKAASVIKIILTEIEGVLNAAYCVFQSIPATDFRRSRTAFQSNPDTVSADPGHRFSGIPDTEGVGG